MTSLMMHVKTVVIGRFTIPCEQASMGIYDESALDERALLDQPIDNNQYVDFVARLLKYKLIKYDQELYPELDNAEERKKLLALID